ncbi:MAG: hypothetical protein ACRC0M_08170 [Legionella sp.]
MDNSSISSILHQKNCNNSIIYHLMQRERVLTNYNGWLRLAFAALYLKLWSE